MLDCAETAEPDSVEDDALGREIAGTEAAIAKADEAIAEIETLIVQRRENIRRLSVELKAMKRAAVLRPVAAPVVSGFALSTAQPASAGQDRGSARSRWEAPLEAPRAPDTEQSGGASPSSEPQTREPQTRESQTRESQTRAWPTLFRNLRATSPVSGKNTGGQATGGN